MPGPPFGFRKPQLEVRRFKHRAHKGALAKEKIQEFKLMWHYCCGGCKAQFLSNLKEDLISFLCMDLPCGQMQWLEGVRHIVKYTPECGVA